ncbi:uncharacterized protein LOC130265494 [Oenanthe melanoleuca]|uniref:uncharacterized protein LOC130265494 n=1 Tax=Oenanthe melanoleuca TaxID=2939378 RepID=UPI0024C1AE31|nr:uncharacterized protein LOC130265494 [Oenanthe melanoleuca]
MAVAPPGKRIYKEGTKPAAAPPRGVKENVRAAALQALRTAPVSYLLITVCAIISHCLLDCLVACKGRHLGGRVCRHLFSLSPLTQLPAVGTIPKKAFPVSLGSHGLPGTSTVCCNLSSIVDSSLGTSSVNSLGLWDAYHQTKSTIETPSLNTLTFEMNKKTNQNYFQEAIAKESNIKLNFRLEGDGKGEFNASRTGLKSTLSFQDVLSLKQQNNNCVVHHYFKFEVLSSMQKKIENVNYHSI